MEASVGLVYLCGLPSCISGFYCDALTSCLFLLHRQLQPLEACGLWIGPETGYVELSGMCFAASTAAALEHIWPLVASVGRRGYVELVPVVVSCVHAMSKWGRLGPTFQGGVQEFDGLAPLV